MRRSSAGDSPFRPPVFEVWTWWWGGRGFDRITTMNEKQFQEYRSAALRDNWNVVLDEPSGFIVKNENEDPIYWGFWKGPNPPQTSEAFKMWIEVTEAGQAGQERLGELRMAFAGINTNTIAANPEKFAPSKTIVFRQGTAYWSQTTKHAIQSSYMRGIGRKRWNLVDSQTKTPKGQPDFPVPQIAKQCSNTYTPVCYFFGANHEVPEEDVYVYLTDVLGMQTPKPIEKIVEKVVEREVVVVRGADTLEKQEALAFALSREFVVTHDELEWAHEHNDGSYALRLAHRLTVLRELMTDFGVKQLSGRPSWLLEHNEEGQMEAFPDAM